MPSTSPTAASRLGYRTGPPEWARFAARQSVFLTSHFDALHPRWLDSSHRLGTAYLHGRPGTPGVPEFDECFETLRQRRDRIDRVQVTHAEMHELVLAAGVEPERVFRIPIGIDLEHFPLGDADAREERAIGARASLDRFRRRLVPERRCRLRRRARAEARQGAGRARRGAREAASRGPRAVRPAHGTGARIRPPRARTARDPVPCTCSRARARSSAAPTARWTCTSCRRGRRAGPKAVLEAMATGVPLVTTRVGQAQELVEDGRNGLLVDVDDPDGARRLCRTGPRRLRARGIASARRAGRLPSSTRSSVWTRSGLGSSKGSSAVRIDGARVGRYARAGARWARLLTRRRTAPGIPRLLRPRPRPRAR